MQTEHVSSQEKYFDLYTEHTPLEATREKEQFFCPKSMSSLYTDLVRSNLPLGHSWRLNGGLHDAG